jgi:hypothetical protein
MRGSNLRGFTQTASALLVAFVVTACAAAATPPPTIVAVATPVITPDPHLAAPASVDQVFRLLGAAGLRITPNTASGGPDEEPVKRINGTYASWPIVLTQFTSAEALRKVGRFDVRKPPGRGEAPYVLAGLNILIEFGPQVTNDGRPAIPDPTKEDALMALVIVLDPLLGPLAQRSVEPVPLPTATALPGASIPASPAPSRSAAGSSAP